MLNELKVVTSYPAKDDGMLTVTRRDISGGINTRQHPSRLGENQATVLTNIDIEIAGKWTKRLGSTLIGDDVSNNSVVHLHNYIRQGYTDDLLMIESNDIYANEEEAAAWTWVTSATASAGTWGSVQAKESGLVPDDIVIVQNGTDNPLRLHKDSSETWAVQDLGNTTGASASCPKSNVMCWYGNRVWVLKNDILYFSDAYDSDYSTAFDTVTNWFRVPVGEERFLIPTRDLGIIVGGKEAVWALAPSATPNPATDKPEPIITDRGCVSKNAVAQIGDDIYFFSQDGLRALKRTEQDKVQLGGSYAISYVLKDSFDSISWAYIDQLKMGYSNNRLFVSVPTAVSSYDVWVYYPPYNAFTTFEGWSPRCWSVYKVNGEERMYYGKHGNGAVYRALYGWTDEGTTTTDGTTITSTIETREEDMGQPLVDKNGGEVEIEAEVAGADNTFSILAAKNGGAFESLGTVSLTSGTAPTLPVNLPFSLAGSFIIREKFHLEGFENWRTLQLQIVNSDANTDPIICYGYNLVTFKEEYQNE